MTKAFLASCGLLFVAAAGASPVRGAESLGLLFVCDSSQDRVFRFEDIDRSGTFDLDVAGEVLPFYDASGGGPELSVPSHMAAGEDGAIYLLDGGTLDSILRLHDLDGDGDANDPAELAIFYDGSAGGPSLATPNTLTRLSDGSLLVCDDGSAARRILRLADTNGDGDALDDGEAVVVYDGSSAAPVVLEDPESLAEAPDGALFVGDSTLQSVYRLEDRDGNGDYLGPDEVTRFFNGGDTLPLADLDSLVVADDGHLYAADEDTGLVLRLEDLDGNGDAMGDGEATPFLDETGAVVVRDVNDMTALPGGGLVLLDGAADAVFVAADGNGDGDALDEGEVRPLLLDGGETLSTPSGIVVIAPSTVAPEIFLRGDANRDGSQNIADAVTTLEFLFLFGGAGACEDAMDSDDSGDLNISDPIYLLNHLFLGGPALPPPSSEAGADPTEDSLSCPPAS